MIDSVVETGLRDAVESSHIVPNDREVLPRCDRNTCIGGNVILASNMLDSRLSCNLQ